MISSVRWTVTLSGSRRDVERLVAEAFPGLSIVEGAPRDLILELDDPEGDAVGDEIAHAARAVIDATVRQINAFGKLRWGRSFEGVSGSVIQSVDSEGHGTQHVLLETAYDHMPFEEYADMVVRLGHPRPKPPAGLDVINSLSGRAVTTLAATDPEVARVLHLVDLMLARDDRIDWVAAYSALEAIEQDLRDRSLNGHSLGWWTRTERDNFRATANSVEVLGVDARHGRRFGLTAARMTNKDAGWFIRRAVALWVTHLLNEDDHRAG